MIRREQRGGDAQGRAADGGPGGSQAVREAPAKALCHKEKRQVGHGGGKPSWACCTLFRHFLKLDRLAPVSAAASRSAMG